MSLSANSQVDGGASLPEAEKEENRNESKVSGISKIELRISNNVSLQGFCSKDGR